MRDDRVSELSVYSGRTATVGRLAVTRALPVRGRRTVGAWCFLDFFGPLTFVDGTPVEVAPHPHMGLQTVTLVLRGEVAHTDSLGSDAVARPGTVNAMLAGRGISHAERTPARNSGSVFGVQLWIALPEVVRDAAPAFEHLPTPMLETRAGFVEVFAGNFAGLLSPSRYYSALSGAALRGSGLAPFEFDLRADFEYAVVPIEGRCTLEGTQVEVGSFGYLPPGRRSAHIDVPAGAHVLVLGGIPLREPILMWWNFVARSNAELATARADWATGERFGRVPGYGNMRVDAPPFVRLIERRRE